MTEWYLSAVYDFVDSVHRRIHMDLAMAREVSKKVDSHGKYGRPGHRGKAASDPWYFDPSGIPHKICEGVVMT